MSARLSIISCFLLIATAAAPLLAQDAHASLHSPAKLTPHSPHLPWLGFQIDRVSDTVRAQLPRLLKGTGFVITSVDANSPCNEAGILPHDIVWKFGDQILVNEAQLEVLLNHKNPGDVVKITFFRSGQEQQTDIIIGKCPLPTVAIMGPSADSARTGIDKIPEMPVISPTEGQRTATLEIASALIQIETRDEELWLSIDHKGVNIFDDILNDENEKKIPSEWLEPVKELRQTLQKREKKLTP